MRLLRKPVREDQPARSQVLDGDLSRVLLVDRRQVIELHAVVQLHAQQAVHRQLAARVGEAHDHAIDLAVANDRGNLARSVPTTPGLMSDVPTSCRIGVDEADQLDAELLPAIEQLLRQRHGGGAGADDQQALGRADAQREPLEREPPAGDQDDHEHRGDDEDAAADDQRGNPVVQDRQHQRRAAERLNQPDDEVAAIRQRAQVVQVAVVQRDLQHAGDQARPPQQAAVRQLDRDDGRRRTARTAASVTASTISSCSISTSVAVRNVKRPRKSFRTASSPALRRCCVGVVVAVVRRRIVDLGVVQDDAEDALAANRLHGLLRAGVVRPSGAHDEQHAIAQRREQARVGDRRRSAARR